MFLLELKVHSYGTLTAGGIACLVVGSLILFKTPQTVGDFGVARGSSWRSAIGRGDHGRPDDLVVRAWRRKPSTGTAGLVAEEGTALTDIEPEGKVFVHGEYWNARSRGPIRKGARVRVTRVRDMLLEVEEIPRPRPSAERKHERSIRRARASSSSSWSSPSGSSRA